VKYSPCVKLCTSTDKSAANTRWDVKVNKLNVQRALSYFIELPRVYILGLRKSVALRCPESITKRTRIYQRDGAAKKPSTEQSHGDSILLIHSRC
jgi:hypothetical protein